MRGGAAFPVRLAFTKRGKVRWISHRDVARAFERAFRIEALPLAFSEGFNPHPKVSFGLALATGHESDAEYLDVEFREPVDLATLPQRISGALPEGIVVVDAVPLAERAPSLQESVTSSEWLVWVTDAEGGAVDPAALEAAVGALLAAETVEIVKRRKGREGQEDLRPLVVTLTVQGADAAVVPAVHRAPGGLVLLAMELRTQPRSAKPGDVLAALSGIVPSLGGLREARVVRTHQWVETEGERVCPLTAHRRDVVKAAPPEERQLVPEVRAS